MVIYCCVTNHIQKLAYKNYNGLFIHNSAVSSGSARKHSSLSGSAEAIGATSKVASPTWGTSHIEPWKSFIGRTFAFARQEATGGLWAHIELTCSQDHPGCCAENKLKDRRAVQGGSRAQLEAVALTQLKGMVAWTKEAVGGTIRWIVFGLIFIYASIYFMVYYHTRSEFWCKVWSSQQLNK